MNTNKFSDDKLKEIFEKMPEDILPNDFRARVMKNVMAENTRRKKQGDFYYWVGLFAVCAGMLSVIVLAIIIQLGSRELEMNWNILISSFKNIFSSLKGISEYGFYIFVAILSLILLGLDYVLRKHFLRKEDTQKHI